MLTSQKLGNLGFASSAFASLIFLIASALSFSNARCRSSWFNSNLRLIPACADGEASIVRQY